MQMIAMLRELFRPSWVLFTVLYACFSAVHGVKHAASWACPTLLKLSFIIAVVATSTLITWSLLCFTC